MTREALDAVKALLPSLAMKHLSPQPFSDVITALEQAWIERDVTAMELKATISERDNAIMDGLALAVEKDGMQVEIKRLRAENAVKDKEIAALSGRCGSWRTLYEDRLEGFNARFLFTPPRRCSAVGWEDAPLHLACRRGRY